MANTTVNILPTSYKRGSDSWTRGTSVETNQDVAYYFMLPANASASVPLKIVISYKTFGSVSHNGTLKIASGQDASGGSFAQIPFAFPSSSSYAEYEFDLSNVAFPSNGDKFTFLIDHDTSGWTNTKDPSLSVSIPPLELSVSPSSLYTGGAVTLNFANRLSQSLNVEFFYNSTLLASKTAGGNTLDVTCPESWFTTAGVSGNSMTVKVRASDDLGRTSEDVTFTLQKMTAGSVTLVAPKSTTVNGNNAINFSWSYSGAGTLTKTELQWSTDNVDFTNLATVSSGGTTYSAPAYTFPKGSIYWRARVTNSQGLTSAWSSGVSFTVSFPTLSVATSPSSLYAGSNVTLSFTNRLSQALTVEFLYNSTLLYSTTADGDTLSVSCSESWFTTAGIVGNSMSVKVRAYDGLDRTSSDVTFTMLRATGGSFSPVAPRSTTVDGAEKINFAWSYSGDGTLAGSELQWSTDNAVWTNLASVSGSGTFWTAPAIKFPKGTVYWRGRASNSLGMVGNWSNSVSFTVNYSAVSQVVPSSSPTDGIIDASANQLFRVALEASGPVYTPFTVASATFYWREGIAGNFTPVEMTASGQNASVTISAGTFPSGSIQWYAAATDNTGRRTETEHYTLSTLAAEVQALPLSPIDTLESGSMSIVFRWDYGSVDGSPQSAADIQFSADGTTWGDAIHLTGSGTTYTAPAGSFGNGPIYWRVKSYNAAGTDGPWSSPVSFTCYGTATVTGVTASSVPFSEILWQTSGQLAYEIKVQYLPSPDLPGIETAAGRRYGPFFGPNDRSFTLPDPLPNGLNTIAVRVQNSYGLWSSWAEAQTYIANAYPFGTIIYGYNIVNSVLNISLFNDPSEAAREFRLYKNGQRVLTTDEPEFADRTANGGATYVAMKVFADGNFRTTALINPETFLAERYPVEHPMLGPLEEGDFVELRLSENANRAPTIQRTREVAYTQYAGATYPEAEIGEHETLTATGDAAWTYEQEKEAAAFEALLGNEVIYKLPSGEVVVGVLEGFSRRDPRFHKAYSFTITQMDWEAAP